MNQRSSSRVVFVLGTFTVIGILNLLQVNYHLLSLIGFRERIIRYHDGLDSPSLLAQISNPQQHKLGGEGEVNFTMDNGTSILFPKTVTKFYCKRRYNRAGSAIQDYLMAHAFSFHFKRQFAGACGWNKYPHYHQTHVDMIELLGLQNELIVFDECPDTNDTSAILLNDEDLYWYWHDSAIWTTEWIEYIQQRRQKVDRQSARKDTKEDPTMVIHMRRGDVHPCDKYTYSRYLPNSHYLSLIEKYRTKDHKRVILHSEQNSYLEPWSDFDEIDGIELKLDTNPMETWRDILNADVYIMSKSSFSLVPALFSTASKIIYTPFWHEGHPNWIRVSNDIMNASKVQTKMLRDHNCSEIFDTRHRPLKIQHAWRVNVARRPPSTSTNDRSPDFTALPEVHSIMN